MASRFWVGGTASWDATAGTKWATTSGGGGGAAVPTSSDDVFFDGASGAVTVTVAATANCQNLDFTGFTGTFAGSSSLNVYGNLTMAAGMTRTYTGPIAFRATSTGKTLNFNGITMDSSLTFSGAGGGWTFNSNLSTSTTTKTLTLTEGTLDTNGYSIDIGSFNSDNSNTRTLTLGSSTLTLDGSSGWNTGTSTNLTFNANTSTVVLSGGFVTTGITVDSGGISFYNLTMSGLFRGALGDNLTVTNNFTVSGTSASSRVFIRGSVSQRTITAANVSLTNVTFQNIVGAGAGSWSGTVVDNAGLNSGITFTTPVTRYWVGNGGTYQSTSRWSTSSGGASGASIPLVQDTVVFDANSFSSDGQTVTIYGTIADLDFTNIDVNNLTVDIGSNNMYLYGSMIFKNGVGMSLTNSGGAGQIIVLGSDDATYYLDFQDVTSPLSLSQSAYSEYRLLSDIQISATLFVSYGSFDANDFDLTINGFTSNNINSPTITVNMGSGTWNISGSGSTLWNIGNNTNLTLNKETSVVKFTGTLTSNATFTGGGEDYYNFWNATTGAFAVIIAGSNTFNDFKIDAGREMNFTTGTTQTVTTFTATGTAGNEITIDSTTTGTHALVKTGGGQISCDYMNIQHSVATPSNTWYAGTNSTNNQGVSTAGSGWTFSNPPVTMAVTVGAFTLTGVSNTITKTLTTSLSVGTFTLTGNSVALGRFMTLVADVASYVLSWVPFTITTDIAPPTHGSVNYYKNPKFYKYRGEKPLR